MNTNHHTQMTHEALAPYFAPQALKQIVAANLGQDSLSHQIGHDHFHFDNNAFEASYAYIETCRQNAITAIQAGNAPLARAEFGRLTHTVQDFYAHTNYVTLWRNLNPQAAPEQIDPQLDSCINNPKLHSGRLYYPLEILYFLPPLREWALERLPRDSHAHMNKDDESQPDFAYARSAAVQRTRLEWQTLAARLTENEISAITDKGTT